MLEIPKISKMSGEARVIVKILGVGNAGVNLVDRFTIERSSQLETIAINTDLQSLASSVADFKIPIGQKATRGLGTGGDPELGIEAAFESQATLQSALEGAAMIVVCAGLGGGTGSGTLPLLLETARTCGTLTVAILTLPFSFEGRRRMQQAAEALEKIRHYADAVLVFENDRMSENAQPKAAIGETFAKSDTLLAQAGAAIAQLVSGTGPMQTTLGDLASVLRPNQGISLFGFGQAEGGNRAHDALNLALKNPLMDRGRLLAEAERLLIHIDGPADLSLTEVQTIVQEVSKACDDSTRILLGVEAGGPSPAPLTVSLLGVCPASREISVAGKNLPTALSPRPTQPPAPPIPIPAFPTAPAVAPTTPVVAPPDPIFASLPSSFSPTDSPTDSPADSPADRLASIATVCIQEEIPVKKTIAPAEEPFPTQTNIFAVSTPPPSETTRKFPAKSKQEVLQFEPVARGRFEKSEPTIVEGEDIDVPTFLRLKIKVK